MSDNPSDLFAKTPVEPEYLGDAVYASFDGFQIWLHLNDHRSAPLIALEPGVLSNLALYYKRCTGRAL